MTTIEQCRAAALGGHVEQCDHCGHRRVWYNSCRNRTHPHRPLSVGNVHFFDPDSRGLELADPHRRHRRSAHLVPVSTDRSALATFMDTVKKRSEGALTHRVATFVLVLGALVSAEPARAQPERWFEMAVPGSHAGAWRAAGLDPRPDRGPRFVRELIRRRSPGARP